MCWNCSETAVRGFDILMGPGCCAGRPGQPWNGAASSSLENNQAHTSDPARDLFRNTPLGHTNITMTIRQVHPSDSQQREAVRKLEGLRVGWLTEKNGKQSPQKYPQ